MNTTIESIPNYTSIKQKQNAAWASGDYSVVGNTLQVTGENLAEALDLVPGSSVLDVAAGNGNATMAFARRWHRVTSSDYVPGLLEKGKARAEAEGYDVQFQEADAESLPFADDQFDGVVSTFGVMFAPDQAMAASELIRVCKAGGKIGLANWTPSGFIGQLFKTLGRHVPPPSGVQSPARWGDREWLRDHFGGAGEVEAVTRNFTFRYRDAAHFMDVFRRLYGPVEKAFERLDAAGQDALAHDLDLLLAEFNTADDGSLSVLSEYLEVVVRC